MAYWPGSGNSLNNIDYSVCRIGIVHHFLNHTVKFVEDENPCHFLFCYIEWKQSHPFHYWYGKSAVVASTLNEIAGPCCYMPVQRIAFRCASGEMSVNLGEICETVFVACPIAFKFCI